MLKLAVAIALVSSAARGADRPDLRWDTLSWTVEGLALGGRTPLAGLGASIGRPIGTIRENLGANATGFIVTPGLDVTAARLFGPACEPVDNPCDVLPFAFRVAAGPSVKFGLAEGALDPDTRVAHGSLVLSLALAAFAAFHRVDASPLQPSTFFWDLVVRGRLGIMHPSHVFSLAIVVEGVLFNPLTRGVNLGLAVGVSY